MEYRIGRNADNDIVINKQSVSRYHAVIRITEHAIIFEDLGSSNGSYINGNRVFDPIEIKERDIIKIGTELIPWRNYLTQGSDRTEIVNIQKSRPEIIYKATETDVHPIKQTSPSKENSQSTNQQVHQQVIINNTEKSSNGLGTAGFVLGLIGLFTSPFFILGFLGLLFSFIGVFKAPRGLAIAGLTLSIISLVIGTIIVASI
jgi:hypothetical protein